MRTATLAILILCVALGACRTTAEGPEADTAAAPASAPAAPAADAPPASQTRRGAAAPRGASTAPTLPPERDPQYTPEQRNLMIRQICWGQVDKNRALRGDDARVAWVNKCIADKSKEPLGQPAAQ